MEENVAYVHNEEYETPLPYLCQVREKQESQKEHGKGQEQQKGW